MWKSRLYEKADGKGERIIVTETKKEKLFNKFSEIGYYVLDYVIPVLVVINLTLLLIAIIPMLIFYIIHYLGMVMNIFMAA